MNVVIGGHSLVVEVATTEGVRTLVTLHARSLTFKIIIHVRIEFILVEVSEDTVIISLAQIAIL